MNKEDVIFEVYGRTINPSKEVLSSMDEFAKQQSISFITWMKAEDCQHSVKGWSRDRDDHKRHYTEGQLYNLFFKDQLA